jgi:hypothetical protein
MAFEIIEKESLGYAHILKLVYSTLNSDFPNTLEDYWSFLFSLTIMLCFLPTGFIGLHVLVYSAKI